MNGPKPNPIDFEFLKFCNISSFKLPPALVGGIK
jgi:hypothetical protein